ncbi:hypothetical protein BJX99DRAFT_259714 [Aspergillus californicus]
MPQPSIPIISFTPFLNGTAEQRKAVADQIYNAFHEIGFLYLTDSGISQARVDGIFELSRKFFSLPHSFKTRFAVRDPRENQGYTADTGPPTNAQEKPREHKEAYEHRRFANPLCPPGPELAGYDPELANFRETMDAFYAECFTLSRQVLRCLALALKIPGGETFFEGMIEHADPQLRLTHYPPVSASIIMPNSGGAAAGEGETEGEAKEAKDGRILPHCDYGFCTLLFQDSVGGLEVDPFHTGEYIAATPRDGTVLVNLGDLLHRLLNGRVKSTLHRVVAPTSAITAGGMLPARYSIPFFVHPVESTWIDPVVLGTESKKYRPVNAGTWRAWRTAGIYDMGEMERGFLDELGIASEINGPVSVV